MKVNDRVFYFQNGKYHFGRLLPNGARLTEKGLFFCIEEINTHEMIVLPEEQFRVGRKMSVLDHENTMTFDKFIENVNNGRFTNRNGDGCFSDGEYTYKYVNCNVEWLEKYKEIFPYVCWYNK